MNFLTYICALSLVLWTNSEKRVFTLCPVFVTFPFNRYALSFSHSLSTVTPCLCHIPFQPLRPVFVTFPFNRYALSLSHSLSTVHTGSEAQPASYSMGTEGSLSGVKQPRREAFHSSPSAEMKNEWSCTFSPPACL